MIMKENTRVDEEEEIEEVEIEIKIKIMKEIMYQING